MAALRNASRRQRAQRRSPQTAPGAGATPRLYKRAVDILTDRILTGAVPTGTRLYESHVAAEFGVSRAPVRQALVALEAQGLIKRDEGRGFVVAKQKTAPRRALQSAPPDGPVRLISMASWEPIYAKVESAIVARTSFASWRVIESELARHFGVSRTVARDVVSRLHQRGIIRKDGQSRWRAPRLTPDYVAELYELRWVLEPMALRNAGPLIPLNVIREAKRNIDDAVRRAVDLDGAALDRLETELHIDLLGYCGKKTLMDAIRLYQSLLVAHSFLYSFNPRTFPVEPFLPEHERIIDQLARRRFADAANLLEAHLRAALERAVHRIDVVGRQFSGESLPFLKALDRV